jgi:hypothetical protein
MQVNGTIYQHAAAGCWFVRLTIKERYDSTPYNMRGEACGFSYEQASLALANRLRAVSDCLVRGDNLELIVAKLGLREKARRVDYDPVAREKQAKAKPKESDAALLRGTIDFDDFDDFGDVDPPDPWHGVDFSV